nr:hypothetical protein [Bovine gammaherpesvirus 4]
MCSMMLGELTLLPTYKPTRVKPQNLNQWINLDLQQNIFLCLATNIVNTREFSLDDLDKWMNTERTFYTCRAIRRLLLGEGIYPFIHQSMQKMDSLMGNLFQGVGLIIDQDGICTFGNITTNSYLPVIYTGECTDMHLPNYGLRIHALYCSLFMQSCIHYPSMFKLICRYLSMVKFQECYSTFMETLKDMHVQNTCQRNYFKLVTHIMCPNITALPQARGTQQLMFYRFNLLNFLNDWIPNRHLVHIRQTIISNVQKYPNVFFYVCSQRAHEKIRVTNNSILSYHRIISQAMPSLQITTHKRDPGKVSLKMVISTDVGDTWIIYPPYMSMFRIAMSMSVAKHVDTATSQERPHVDQSTLPKILVSMFRRIDYAPKDNTKTMDLTYPFSTTYTKRGNETTNDHFEMYSPVKHTSINNFKVNIFNTNMVINTKIVCERQPNPYSTILDIPRLTNNFVVKKYSMKEPSFTISVFYSENVCQGVAININISGDLLNFLFAMGNLKCFIPINTIYPVSIANWNSTLDLHGLENQNIVRQGRKDVFWTTNFPSAVSCKSGVNVSWFKAATANISKIYGTSLVTQIYKEVNPILSSNYAKLNIQKNQIFTFLETKNKSQIQTLHKRFLECLYECCSFFRLNTRTINSLVQSGIFDFSKRIISHTKSKHECAILGYKRCNLIPKVFTYNKKTRLDELGRNANFITFISSTGNGVLPMKRLIIKHVIRKFGLHWRSRTYRLQREILSTKPYSLHKHVKDLVR